MPTNLTMTRIATKLDELFSGKIDLTDIKNPEETQTAFYSRAIAALALMMRCGVDEDTAARCITDGYHDMALMPFIMIRFRKNLSLFRANGGKMEMAESIKQKRAYLRRVQNALLILTSMDVIKNSCKTSRYYCGVKKYRLSSRDYLLSYGK